MHNPTDSPNNRTASPWAGGCGRRCPAGPTLNSPAATNRNVRFHSCIGRTNGLTSFRRGLDTDVVSEIVRPKPERRDIVLLSVQEDEELRLPVISSG